MSTYRDCSYTSTTSATQRLSLVWSLSPEEAHTCHKPICPIGLFGFFFSGCFGFRSLLLFFTRRPCPRSLIQHSASALSLSPSVYRRLLLAVFHPFLIVFPLASVFDLLIIVIAIIFCRKYRSLDTTSSLVRPCAFRSPPPRLSCPIRRPLSQQRGGSFNLAAFLVARRGRVLGRAPCHRAYPTVGLSGCPVMSRRGGSVTLSSSSHRGAALVAPGRCTTCHSGGRDVLPTCLRSPAPSGIGSGA